MPKYNVDMDVKVQCWMAGQLTVDFPGTEEELREHIKRFNGELGAYDVDYHDWTSIIESEEHMSPEENGGNDVVEIKSITTEAEY